MAASLWTYLTITAVIALITGIMIGRFTRKPNHTTEQLLDELDEANRKHQVYQENVQQHVIESAEILQQLGHSYQHFYQHLVQNSKHLLTSDELHQQLHNESKTSIEATNSIDEPKDYSGESSGLFKGSVH